MDLFNSLTCRPSSAIATFERRSIAPPKTTRRSRRQANKSPVSPEFPSIIELLERCQQRLGPFALAHSSLSCVSVLQWIILARRTRRASYRSCRTFTKKFDQRAGGCSGVLLTSRRIQSMTAFVQRVSARRIRWPVLLILDKLCQQIDPPNKNFLV